MKKKYLILCHILFWLLNMLLANILGYLVDPKTYSLSITGFLLSQITEIFTVYLTIFFCIKYAHTLNTFKLISGILLVFIFTYLSWYIMDYYISPLMETGYSPKPFNVLNFAITVLWNSIKYFALGLGYYYATENFKQQRKIRLIEKEKHEAEYAFLRAQINPHFLNNTLNFFYAKSLPLSEEQANGIMTLSEIMRYSLEIDKDDRMTLLNEEIEHINNVIKINQLRFNNKLQINFNVKGDTNNVRVIPLVLITAVENILKHGNCTDKTHPVKIDLLVNELENSVHLTTWNRKKNGPKELSSGIGMDNTRKRLEHHYGKNFELNINETEDDYTLELNLPYNKVAEYKEKTNSSDQIRFLDQLKLQPINPKPYTS